MPIYLPCLLHDSFVHFHNTLSNLLIYSFDIIQQDYGCGYVQSVEIANKKYGDMMDSETVYKTKPTVKTQSAVEAKSKTNKKDNKTNTALNNRFVFIILYLFTL